MSLGSSGRVPAVAEAAEDLARQQAAGDDAIGAVRVARDALEIASRSSSCVNGVRLPFGRRTVAFGSIVVFFGSNVVRNDSTWL